MLEINKISKQACLYIDISRSQKNKSKNSLHRCWPLRELVWFSQRSVNHYFKALGLKKVVKTTRKEFSLDDDKMLMGERLVINGGFSSHMDNKAGHVFMPWRHHGIENIGVYHHPHFCSNWIRKNIWWKSFDCSCATCNIYFCILIIFLIVVASFCDTISGNSVETPKLTGLSNAKPFGTIRSFFYLGLRNLWLLF